VRAGGLKVLKNNLSEYVRMAAAGETILVTDRYRRVAERAPPRRDRAPGVPDALRPRAVRRGWFPPPLRAFTCLPPRKPVAPLGALLEELAADRADR